MTAPTTDDEDRCLDPDELLAWIGGDLSNDARERALAHVLGCEVCREQASALARMEPSEAAAASPGAASLPIEVGAKIGRFEVLRVIGRGGMGVVVRARDPQLGRDVAIKLVRHDVARAAHLDARLAQEAKALAALRHENLVTVFEVGERDGAPFVVMELVEGTTLRSFAAERGAWQEVLDACKQAGRGLAALHAAGFVHRDVKPDNVIVAGSGRVVVADLGLAQRIPDAAAAARSEPPLTRTGVVVGTPRYLAPERVAGHPADVRADVYAFSAMALEALRACKSSPVPARVREVLGRGQDPDASVRFGSMTELLDALTRATRPRLAMAAVVAGAVLVVGAAGVLATGQEPEALSLPAATPTTTTIATTTATATNDLVPSARPERSEAERETGDVGACADVEVQMEGGTKCRPTAARAWGGPAAHSADEGGQPYPTATPTALALMPAPSTSVSMISGTLFPGTVAPKISLDLFRSLYKPETAADAEKTILENRDRCRIRVPSTPESTAAEAAARENGTWEPHPRDVFPMDIEWGTVEKRDIATIVHDDKPDETLVYQVKGQRARYVFAAVGNGGFLDVAPGGQVVFCVRHAQSGPVPAGFTGDLVSTSARGGPIAGTPALWKRSPRPRYIDRPFLDDGKWRYGSEQVIFQVKKPPDEVLPGGRWWIDAYFMDVAPSLQDKQLLEEASYKKPVWVIATFVEIQTRKDERRVVVRADEILTRFFEAPQP